MTKFLFCVTQATRHLFPRELLQGSISIIEMLVVHQAELLRRPRRTFLSPCQSAPAPPSSPASREIYSAPQIVKAKNRSLKSEGCFSEAGSAVKMKSADLMHLCLLSVFCSKRDFIPCTTQSHYVEVFIEEKTVMAVRKPRCLEARTSCPQEICGAQTFLSRPSTQSDQQKKDNATTHLRTCLCFCNRSPCRLLC